MNAPYQNDDGPLADIPLGKVLALIGVQALSFVTIGAALWTLADRPLGTFVTTSLIETCQGLLLALALIAVFGALGRAFPRYAEWLVRSQARQYPFLKNRISITAIIFISLCAGIGEEALFRGGIQTVLGDYLPIPLALALAAALFALIHFAQPVISALIFVIGCLFGAVYWHTGSLLTVMIGHAVYDIYALWAVQETMHRLGVFDNPAQTPDSPHDTTGETP